jgi:hypothetical protein
MKILVRRPPAAEITCAGCGCAYRAAYTLGRCPICDRPATSNEGAAQPSRRFPRLRALLADRWAAALLIAAIVGNVVVFVVVVVAASR